MVQSQIVSGFWINIRGRILRVGKSGTKVFFGSEIQFLKEPLLTLEAALTVKKPSALSRPD